MAKQESKKKVDVKKDEVSTVTSKETLFLELPPLPTPLNQDQCVVYKDEILICGGYHENKCYSYHMKKKEYKLICSYPEGVELWGHCVIKLVNNNKNPNEITLLSFGGYRKHTLVMKYTSIWEEEGKEIETKKKKEENGSNPRKYLYQWVPFTNTDNKPVVIGREEDFYNGVRGIVGGNKNNLLFITYYPNNIDVFDLNTYQYVNYSTLPTYWMSYHCFVIKATEKKTNSNEMVLFKEKTGLAIEYDEYNHKFTFTTLGVCDDIAPFHNYSYVCINNDFILFFGGWDGSKQTNQVYKYSIKENKWTKFVEKTQILPFNMFGGVAIWNEDHNSVHIVGGHNGKERLSTHLKTNVEEWMNNIEIKQMREKGKDKSTKNVKSLDTTD